MSIENHIGTFLSGHERQMFTLLEMMVRIQSGSFHKAGVDAMARLIASTLNDCSVTCRFVTQEDFGNHLVVRSHCAPTLSGQILLVGHMDTVFPKDTVFNTYREDQDHAYGPGVIDMKGGLTAGIFALKALNAAGLLTRIPLCFVFNSDEEIGSKTSKNLIRQEANRSFCAFVLECGGPNGEVVTGRKGILSVKIGIKGRAGHAAFAGKNKASAILEMAHKTIAIEALNCPEKGITANVGKISGGIGPNTVAEKAQALVDFRFLHSGDDRDLLCRIDDILTDVNVVGTSAQVDVLTLRPPMPTDGNNRDLFQRVAHTARSLGMTIEEEFRHGASDANIIAAEGVPVIDGMGPMGGKDHSPEEYMIKSSLPQRALLLACTLANLMPY